MVTILECPIAALQTEGIFVKELRMAFIEAWMTAFKPPLTPLVASAFGR